MTLEDLGGIYKHKETGEIFKLVSYTDQPTATLLSFHDDKRIRGVVGSPLLQKFIKLVPEGEKNDVHE